MAQTVKLENGHEKIEAITSADVPPCMIDDPHIARLVNACRRLHEVDHASEVKFESNVLRVELSDGREAEFTFSDSTLNWYYLTIGAPGHPWHETATLLLPGIRQTLRDLNAKWPLTKFIWESV